MRARFIADLWWQSHQVSGHYPDPVRDHVVAFHHDVARAQLHFERPFFSQQPLSSSLKLALPCALDKIFLLSKECPSL
jgi:hypothetical protein